MNKFTRVMIVIDWLFAMAGGVVLLVAVSQVTGESTGLLEQLPVQPVIVGSAALLLLNVIWMIMGIRGVGRERYVYSGSSSGQVRTAVSAIDESLTRSALAQPEVSGARVRVVLGGDGRTPARIMANVSFVETSNQIGAQQVLQSVLLERFKEIVTLQEDVPVDINVVRFSTEKKGSGERRGRDSRGRGAEDAEERRDEFRGPRYPVGG